MAALLKTGSRSPAVRSVQQMLHDLGYQARIWKKGQEFFELITIDGIYGPQTESAVIQFQEDENLAADGIVGPLTMTALEDAYSKRSGESVSAGVDFLDGDEDAPEQPAVLPKTRIDVDAYQNGYSHITLRADVAEQLQNVVDEVHAKGGLITSSGGMRYLSAPVTPGRSATSMHYTGRALDLFIYSGMQNLATDPYVIVRKEARTYQVYARCTKKNNSRADLPEKIKLENCVTVNNRTKGKSIEGHFLDLTALLEKHDFFPIKARRRFEEGGSYIGAEWWHFQNEKGLIPNVSTFGRELLTLYKESTLKKSPPWRFRDRIFKVNWF